MLMGMRFLRNSSIGLLAIAGSLIPLCGVAKAALPKKPVPPILFILAGQSNMVGYATPVPAEKPDPRILSVNWEGKIVPATDPLGNLAVDVHAGVGPAIAFAKRIAAATGRKVVIDMCAIGGTTIDNWEPGGNLYNGCLDRARTVKGAQVGGVLVFQGEAEQYHPDTISLWPQKFSNLVASFRTDLHNQKLPVVFAQIANTPSSSYTDGMESQLKLTVEIQEEQRAVRLPYVSMIYTGDLPYGTADLYGHFSADSYRIIGSRFAQAWLGIVKPS